MNKKVFFPAVLVLGIIISSATLDLSNLYNYANQAKPNYITKDNTGSNILTDKGATLGRVMFYDKKLSKNNTIACASCHKQEFAFGDTSQASIGVNGTTGRHSMRLINSRFSDEVKFFWDERAATLEIQTTQPIQDHTEMGFSGTSGDPDLDSLRRKIASIGYYKTLFKFVYGDTVVTEQRIQNALAQFVRSIQSFDSKFDIGRATAPNDNAPFTNYTAQENAGKNLFLAPPQIGPGGIRIGGGAGCGGCHRAPEFDIDPNTGNNGVVGKIGSTALDFTNTKAPSLRDVVKANGTSNGPFMHVGLSNNFITVIDHYDSIVVAPGNTTIDPRLVPAGNPQKLRLTTQEKNDLVAFIRTLAGTDVYTNVKWSNPFTNDSIVISGYTGISLKEENDKINFYPNPVLDYLNIEYPRYFENSIVKVYSSSGQIVLEQNISTIINFSTLEKGIYFIQIGDLFTKIIKL